jgi:hypothetical protein
MENLRSIKFIKGTSLNCPFRSLPQERATIFPPDFSNSEDWRDQLNFSPERKFGYLSDNGFTRTEAPNVYELKNVLVHSKSLGQARTMVEISDGVVLSDTYFDANWLTSALRHSVEVKVGQSNLSINLTDAPRNHEIEITGKCFLFNHQWMSNHFHTIIETGSRFYLHDRLFYRERMRAIYSIENQIQREFFELLNADFDLVDTKFTTAHVPEILVPTIVEVDGLSSRYVNWLRNKVSPNGATGNNKFYITRKGAAHRDITNEEEVEEFLIQNGFATIDFSSMSLKEQISLVSSASVIVGVQGAGLANIVFGHNLRVIEFVPSLAPHPAYWWISKWLGHTYGRLVCYCLPGTNHVTVDINGLKESLTALNL